MSSKSNLHVPSSLYLCVADARLSTDTDARCCDVFTIPADWLNILRLVMSLKH